jgi:hypothetical protein
MKPIRIVDPRVLLEAACGLALGLALLMPFYTVSAKSYVPVSAVTSIVDSIPQQLIADLFVAVAGLSLILSGWRILRSSSGFVVIFASLATFVAAGVLVAILQIQWNDATSGWQMDAARLLGVQFSQSSGFWVFLGAAVVGGLLVLTEVISWLIGLSKPAHDPAFVPRTDAPSEMLPVRAESSVVAETPESAAGSGRLAVLEAGRPTSTLVELGQSVILGRDPGCDVRLADPNVSRRHASIERVAGGWTVRDLATKNPSRVIGPGGSSFEVGMGVSLASGQLLVGDALITLYP